MFAPSINVDLEKLQQAAEDQPQPRRASRAARNKKSTTKPAPAPEKED